MHLAAGPGLAPDPTGGANSASPDPLAGFWGAKGKMEKNGKRGKEKGAPGSPSWILGPTSKGRDNEWEKRKGEGKGRDYHGLHLPKVN